MELFGFGAAELMYVVPTVGALLLDIYLLVHMLNSGVLTPLEKFAWAFVIVAIPFFGPLYYLFKQYPLDKKRK